MIRINKAAHKIPDILGENGKAETVTENLKTDFDKGNKVFKFDGKIYGHKSVKKELRDSQHNKCCFCEAKVSHISHGDVEHFRPKGGYYSKESDLLMTPGYYWLAYDFSNLFFSCQLCNQIYKKNYFPLVDETRRAKSHHDQWANEESLILHPEFDNPENHITFVAEVVLPKNISEKGKETIRRTGIDRKELEDNRLEYFVILSQLAKVARSALPEADEARVLFKNLGLPMAQYSAMVRANFPDLL